ncbi:MAG: glutamine--fructose-6-phosphate aminotransferase, partial [Agathobacter sp.]
MCGIVGYVGKEQAAPILLDGLSKLEYRGYDSAGMAIYDGQHINIEKAMGRLKVLSELTHDGATMPGCVGIGHTRWATHG